MIKELFLIGMCMFLLLFGCSNNTPEEKVLLIVKYIDNSCVGYYPDIQYYLQFENVSEEDCPIGEHTKEGLDQIIKDYS